MSQIAIVGGGPAGLSLARLLTDKGIHATVFEADARVGGKSYTVLRGDTLIEMGTCYATTAHRIALGWMRELGFKQKRVREQVLDGEDFVNFIRRGSGASLPAQVLTYLRARSRLMKRLAVPHPSQDALDEAAMPILDWLRARDLGKMELFFLRGITGIAYGYLDETPTLQALRWIDFDLIWTGVRRKLTMPKDGWSIFWAALAEGLDVKTRSRVSHIERRRDGITVSTREGSETFAAVVCAIPPDEFAALLDSPSDDEKSICEGIRWGDYVTTLLVAKNWFVDHPVEAYSEPLRPGMPRGKLLSARLEGHEAELGGPLYLTGQYGGDYTDDELKEILAAELQDRDAELTSVLIQKRWKLMPFYRRDALRSGLLKTIRAVQGRNRTFYTGAAFSHEAVSNIVNFNAELAEAMSEIRFSVQNRSPNTDVGALARHAS